MSISTLYRRCFIVLSVLALLPSHGRAQEAGHLHHVHMNVADIGTTSEFYQRIFGVESIEYNQRVPALLVGRSFLFMHEMPAATIANHELTGFAHIGWGTVDGKQTYQWLKDQGVEFYLPVSELLPGSTYMYMYGPDHEVIEQFDYFKHHRFSHVHMIAQDPGQTARWFAAVLAFQGSITEGLYDSRNLSIDGVGLNIFPVGARFTPRENDGSLRPTDGSNLDHIAFSFRDLDAELERTTKAGYTPVRPMSVDAEYGFRHYFLRAPNGVLVELLEANPWPEAAWVKP